MILKMHSRDSEEEEIKSIGEPSKRKAGGVEP